MQKKFFPIIIFIFFCNICPLLLYAMPKSDVDLLHRLIKQVQNPQVDKQHVNNIYRKGDLLYCEGELPTAITNNRAADLIAENKFEEAIEILEKAMQNAALFLPFRYNLGIAYYSILDFPRAHVNLRKAKQLVPEYYMIYIQIGHALDLEGKYEESILSYRKALSLNRKHIDAAVLIGDGYFKIGRVEMASNFYEIALESDPFFNNALLGKAKILFYREKYYQAYMLLRLINTEKDYNKAYHYYMAECTYSLQLYSESYEHFKELLNHTSDRFFLSISRSLIEHKLGMAQRFAELDD